MSLLHVVVLSLYPQLAFCGGGKDKTRDVSFLHSGTATNPSRDTGDITEVAVSRLAWLESIALHEHSDFRVRFARRAGSANSSQVSSECPSDSTHWCPGGPLSHTRTHEPPSYLEVLPKSQVYRRPSRFLGVGEAKIPSSIAQVVVSTYDEDLSWLKDLDDLSVQVYVHDRTSDRDGLHAGKKQSVQIDAAIRSEEELKARHVARSDPIKFMDIPNIGDEAKAYLTYITENYEVLPQAAFFVHGHRCSWHMSIDMASRIRDIASCVSNGSKQLSYVNLNTGNTDCYSLVDPYADSLGDRISHVATLWKSIMSTELPHRYCMDCCAQFVVSRDALLSHPKAFYENLMSVNVNGKSSLEYFWRSIFKRDWT